jgi:ATP-dependent Clp protease, protease subunit
MQTTGGNVQDGVCLYNYFRTLPVDLSVYNVGSISSAGVIAYLGAKNRKAATLATFMIHRSHASFQGANVDTIQARPA